MSAAGPSIRDLPLEMFVAVFGAIGADGGLAALFRLRVTSRALWSRLEPRGRALAAWAAVRPARFLRPVLHPASTARSLAVLHEVYTIPRTDALAHEGMALLAAGADGRLDLLQWLVQTFNVTAGELVNLGARYKHNHSFDELLHCPPPEVRKANEKKGGDDSSDEDSSDDSSDEDPPSEDEWAQYGNKAKVAKDSPIHAKSLNRFEATVVQVACENGHLDTVRWLYGRVENVLRKSGIAKERLLYIAITNGHLAIVEWLYERIRPRDRYFVDRDPFLEACSRGHLAVARFLLERHISDIHADTRTKALERARRAGRTAVVAWLKTLS